MLGAPADLLSLLYLAVALYTLWQLPSRWRALTDATYTPDDQNLAHRIGFLLLTPLGVLVHELAHMTAAALFGARDISLSFRIYWGYVQYRGQLGPVAEWVVASAGPAASLVLGLAVGYGVLRLRPVWRDIGMAFAHATLLLDLVLYPGLSLVDGVGDFRWIYSAQTPVLAGLAGVVHVGGLVAYIVLARLQSRRSRQEARQALSARFSGQHVILRGDVLARLDALEAAERVRRLEPDERAELEHLRELRAWSDEHNRALAAAADAELDALGPGADVGRGSGPGASHAPYAPPPQAPPAPPERDRPS